MAYASSALICLGGGWAVGGRGTKGARGGLSAQMAADPYLIFPSFDFADSTPFYLTDHLLPHSPLFCLHYILTVELEEQVMNTQMETINFLLINLPHQLTDHFYHNTNEKAVQLR